MTSDLFIGFLTDLSRKYEKPILIVLDNASVHTAKKIEIHREFLKSKGVHLYFLPTYSPELNRIEMLWHQMKYVWMEVKGRTFDALKSEVENILQNFGSEFNLSFK